MEYQNSSHLKRALGTLLETRDDEHKTKKIVWRQKQKKAAKKSRKKPRHPKKGGSCRKKRHKKVVEKSGEKNLPRTRGVGRRRRPRYLTYFKKPEPQSPAFYFCV